MWNGKERRIAPRAEFDCKIIVTYPDHEITARTENISTGGARFILNEELPVYDIIGIKFFFEKGKHVLCEARVRWVIKKGDSSPTTPLYDTGVEFIYISETDQKYIERLINTILKKQ